jgi:hypothetical protein
MVLACQVAFLTARPHALAGEGRQLIMVISRAWCWVRVAGWGIAERERGLDERGVGESLRVVAEVRVGGWVHLLAEEADRLASASSCSNSSAASWYRPVLASAWTSQNEHGRNAPSGQGRPSVPGG